MKVKKIIFMFILLFVGLVTLSSCKLFNKPTPPESTVTDTLPTEPSTKVTTEVPTETEVPPTKDTTVAPTETEVPPTEGGTIEPTPTPTVEDTKSEGEVDVSEWFTDPTE